MSYIVIMSTRDGGSLLEATLSSLMSQTVLPKALSIVVDGGDIPSTLQIIKDNCRVPHVVVEHKGVKYARRDIRRMPENLNEAYNAGRDLAGSFDFLLITGDDCRYPPSYAETLMRRMLEESVVVASGICAFKGEPGRRMKSPMGSGRMIRHDYWLKVGASFPVSYAWESWILYRAMMDGENIRLYGDLRFEHLHPFGRTHRCYHWGRARYLMGYSPLTVLGEVTLSLLGMESTLSRVDWLRILTGYLTAPLYFKLTKDPYANFPSEIREFVRETQLKNLKEKLRRLITTPSREEEKGRGRGSPYALESM